MGLKRYQVEAKRNVTWTEWTEANTYKKAKAHARYCESVGYTARIVADESVEELWNILGGKTPDNTILPQLWSEDERRW